MRVHRNCCGLDVHKETIAACLISESEDGTSSRQKRIFGTMTQQLRELAQWLAEAKVTAVAMEATGIYWVPVWNVLEQYGFELLLINPEHYKAVRGKKTDLKDGERIAELLQDGRLAGSYIPPVAIRVLRDLTRYRTKLVQYQSSIANRIQRLLEQCNVRLASVTVVRERLLNPPPCPLRRHWWAAVLTAKKVRSHKWSPTRRTASTCLCLVGWLHRLR
jgi:transposase